jgi:hypothetical protein
MLSFSKVPMSIQGTDQEVWEDSLVRTADTRLADFLLLEQSLKMLSWFLIGGVFVGLVLVRLLGTYHVPLGLIFLSFLGQGCFLVGIYYLTQIRVPSKDHPIHDSPE